MGKHAGKTDYWAQAMGRVKRGLVGAPRHAKPGRKSAPTSVIARLTMAVTGHYYGWTPASVAHAVRIGAL